MTATRNSGSAWRHVRPFRRPNRRRFMGLWLVAGWIGLSGTLSTVVAQPVKGQRPRTAWGIEWQPSLPQALEAAREASDPRPVMHLRVLGDLTGFM